MNMIKQLIELANKLDSKGYKKEASAKMRNAKIRLSNMKTKEMAQILRNKAKWIKH